MAVEGRWPTQRLAGCEWVAVALLTVHPPPPPKWGTQPKRVGGSKSKKSFGHQFVSQNDDGAELLEGAEGEENFFGAKGAKR